jgi:proteasome alpha subunit
MGGEFEKIAEAVKAEYREGMSNQEALALALSVLTVEPESTKDAPAVKSPLGLEVALLDRTRSHRTFIRFNSNRIAEMTQ